MPTKPPIDANNLEKHCVRCHARFKEGGKSPCTIPHAFDEDNQEYGRFPSKCCGGRVGLKEEGYGNDDWTNLHTFGFCLKGRHTTDVAKAKGRYNGVNISPCKIDMKSGKCIRPWVNQGRNPVFSWQFDIDSTDDEDE